MALGSLKHQYPNRNFKVVSFRVVGRSIIKHPFVMVMPLFFICLHQYFPFLFSLLVSALPVVIGTAILLGTLLIHGQPNDNNVKYHEEWNNTCVTLRSGGEDRTSSAGREGIFCKDRFAEVRKDIVEKGMRTSGMLNSRNNVNNDLNNEVARQNHNSKLSEGRNIHRANSKNDFGFANFEKAGVEMCIDREYDKTIKEQHEVGMQDQLNSFMGLKKHEDDVNNEFSDCESDGAEKSSLDALVAYVIPTAQETHPLLDYVDQLHLDESHDDASLKFELQSLDSNQSNEDTSEDGNDDNANEDETLNVKDDEGKLANAWMEMEKNQHLESLISKTDDEKDEEEEVEDDEGSEDMDIDDDDDDEEEAENENVEKHMTKQVTLWTEEDEKNLRLVGNSELERDLRLENLLARRRAKRNFSLISEKNLIDLDRPDPLPFPVAPILTIRINPFDTHDSNQQHNCAPSIPGSAPSISLPRKNPFDSPVTSPKGVHNLKGEILKEDPMEITSNNAVLYEHESSSTRFDNEQNIVKPDFGEIMNRKDNVFRRYDSFNPGFYFQGDTYRQDFVETDRRDAILRKHETFNTRSTFPSFSGPTEKAFYTKLKPVFVPEQVVEDPELRHPSLRRESSLSNESIESFSESDDHIESSTYLGKHEDVGSKKDTTSDCDHASTQSEDTTVSSKEVESLHDDKELAIVDNLDSNAEVDQIHQKIEAPCEHHDNISSTSSSTLKEDHNSEEDTGQDDDNTIHQYGFSPKASLNVLDVNYTSMEEDHGTIESPIYDASP